MVEPLPEECPRCHGRGWVIVADGGAGTARPCECRLQAMGPRLLDASGIPAQYRACSLDGFRASHPDAAARDQLARALAESRAYVDGFLRANGRFAEAGLIYVGPTGTGKTHLAAAVATALIERYRVGCRFVEFTALVHEIQSTFSPNAGGSKGEILEPVMEAELLVLDELGAQRPTPWVQDLLYLIINTRYTERRPTIFTTNYRLAEATARSGAAEAVDTLTHRLPATLVSRLFEMAKPVQLDAVSDYRREVRNVSFRSDR